MTLYPYGYSNEMVSFETMVERSRKHNIEPEYERRLFNWIKAQGGQIGIGSGWRAPGADTSPASSANKSFHQDQQFSNGFIGYSAVDLVAVNPGGVHRAPYWNEVLEQGRPECVTWGVHCNVPNEPWHMQCIEQDGFDSWVKAGRNPPVPFYPIPGDGPEPAPTPDPGDDDMAVKTLLKALNHNAPYGTWYICGSNTKTWISDGNALNQFGFRCAEAQGQAVDYDSPPPPIPDNLPLTAKTAVDGYRYCVCTNANPDFVASFGPIVGPIPDGVDEYGR